MSPRPFLFDHAFDSGEAPAKPEPEPPPPTYDEAALAAARDAAYAEGLAAGQAQARTEFEESAAYSAGQTRTLIGQHMAQALAAAEAGAAQAEAAAAIATARAVGLAFPAFSKAKGDFEVLETVRDALARAMDEPRIVCRLAAADYEAIAPELDVAAEHAGFAGRVIAIEDAAVAQGDVRIEWADGGLARDLDRLTQAIVEAINGLVTTEDSAPMGAEISDPGADE